MRIGVSMWSYVSAWKAGQLDVPGFVLEAKRAGAEGVELLEFFYREGPDRRPEVLHALRETGLPCPVFSISNNFARDTAAEREAEVAKIRAGVDEAITHGASIVRVFAGDIREGLTFEQVRHWIIEGLAAGSAYAAERGVKLALENHGKLAGRGDQVRGIIADVREACGNDALGANPDTGNFLLVLQPSHEAIQEVASLAAMVHFKDFQPAPAGHDGFAYQDLEGNRLVGTAVGEGAVDLRSCLMALKASGFDGWLNVEYEGEEDPFEAVPRSIANARRILDSL